VAVFGALALVLALVGTYGVTSYSVAQRTREIAIRSALGADPLSIVRGVLGRVLGVAGGGAVAGVLLALPLVRVLSGLLYDVDPFDVPTFAAVLALLILTAVAAGALPARRAARIAPVDALRL
jgi:ABC-type antimicrobial peptide transport system permease subunit